MAETQEVEGLVRSKFTVKEFFVLPEGELEFQIVYDGQTKSKFAQLEAEISSTGYRPELAGTEEEAVLTVRRAGAERKNPSRTTVILALFTLASVVVFAIGEVLNYQELAPSVSSYFVLFAFAIGAMVILGAHELGQRVVGRRTRAGHANSYLIPWIPFFPPGPSLGFTSTQREPALNRDALFDTVLAGPLFVLAFALVIYALGDVTSTQSTLLYQWATTPNSPTLTNPSVLESAVDFILGPVLPKVAANALPVSPLADAATIGFIILFMDLLPLGTFDGGLMMNAAGGERAVRVATYLAAFGLLVIDTPTYWALAVFALLLAGRPANLKLLDNVSGLSAYRRWIFVGSLVLAFLCLPIPHNLGTISLP